MLAFTSDISPWQLEEENMINELPYDELFAYSSPNHRQDASNNSSTSSPHPQELDSQLENPNSAKKSTHNEYERDRRKKLNSLYLSLRNLLPEADQSKKLSIPCTIARVLKYIPELQRRIETLTRKKEEILLKISKKECSSSTFNNDQNLTISPVISATFLNGKEVMVQICVRNMSATVPVSKVMKILEEEGLQVLNASTFATHAGGTFYNLHLQAKDVIRMEGQSYCVYLISVLKRQAKKELPQLLYLNRLHLGQQDGRVY